jgi:hypothetical protein
MLGRDKPVKLGETYRDPITGLEGVATARAEYLYGCVRVVLEGTGDLKDGVWFDEQRLTDKPKATSGGARPAPPSRDPAR